MATYQRFQTLSAAEQHLFGPQSPVLVSRYQLSLDLESGKRLLQVRMVNLSEKRIRQVFLRVICFDAAHTRLAQLELVPVPAVSALPGRIFGDNRVVELTPPGTSFVEVFAQRVRFYDGSTWDEERDQDYIAFPPPEPVKQEDPAYDRLSRSAIAGGVRCEYYYHAQAGLWICTCGLPNGSRSLRCAHCGAKRAWLEKHMDREGQPAAAPEPEKEPETTAEKLPAPEPVVITAPPVVRPVSPVEEFGLAGLLRPEPTHTPGPAPEPEPEPEPEPSHAGRTVAIILAVLLFLGAGAFGTYRYLMPYLRYREAVTEQSNGNYDRAVELFEELGEYKDSPERITKTIAQRAFDLMAEGKYPEALAVFDTLEGYEKNAADCVYSMGVLAFNNGELEKAMGYARQLEERDPDYEKLPELQQFCMYSLGNRTAAEAGEAETSDERIALYQQAIGYYTEADYEDSADRITECRYRIAIEYMGLDALTEAIEAFEQLAGYKQSDDFRKDCMFRYAQAHLENVDEVTMAYLETLAGEGYDGAQALLDRLNGDGFYFRLTEGSQDIPGALVTDTVEDLSQLYIHYSVDYVDEDGAVLVLLCYTLPDGTSGRGLLNRNRESRGVVGWTEFPFPADCRISGTVRLEFYDSMRGDDAEPLEVITFTYNRQEKEEGDKEEGHGK